MVIMEIANKDTGIIIEKAFFNQMYEAKNTAIRLAGYAGFFNFEKDRDGDISANNRTFKVDIVRM